MSHGERVLFQAERRDREQHGGEQPLILLSSRAKLPVIPSEAPCHSERSEESALGKPRQVQIPRRFASRDDRKGCFAPGDDKSRRPRNVEQSLSRRRGSL